MRRGITHSKRHTEKKEDRGKTDTSREIQTRVAVRIELKG